MRQLSHKPYYRSTKASRSKCLRPMLVSARLGTRLLIRSGACRYDNRFWQQILLIDGYWCFVCVCVCVCACVCVCVRERERERERDGQRGRPLAC
jgi:hypothetical protein